MKKEVSTNDHLSNKLLHILWGFCWVLIQGPRRKDANLVKKCAMIIISITQMYKFPLKQRRLEKENRRELGQEEIAALKFH